MFGARRHSCSPTRKRLPTCGDSPDDADETSSSTTSNPNQTKNGGSWRPSTALCEHLWRTLTVLVLASQLCMIVMFTSSMTQHEVAISELRNAVFENLKRGSGSEARSTLTSAVLRNDGDDDKVVSRVESAGRSERPAGEGSSADDEVETAVNRGPEIDGDPGEDFVRRSKRRATYKDNRLPDEEEELLPLGPVSNGNKSVPFHSVSYITETTIRKVCSKTKDLCPPAPQGPPGFPGLPGKPGGAGPKGMRGKPGPVGPPGNPGVKGDRGYEGTKGVKGDPGLNGLDGLPGEPGLDGIPGRNGLDGIPAVDGIPGRDGIPGVPGRNGTDGKTGPRGSKGDKGDQGPQGLAGRMGRRGDKGDRGRDGTPGIKAWKINETEVTKILVPPKIVKFPRELASTEGEFDKPLVLYEGENLRLDCTASGRPEPDLKWMKWGAEPFQMGKWKTNGIAGKYFNLTGIHREHMGKYVCAASNGIPPDDYKIFNVEVHFPPYIEVRRRMVPAPRGKWAFLVCDVEAYPEAVTFWERGVDDKVIAKTQGKYVLNVTQKEGSKYKYNMTLNITHMSSEDFGQYRCVASNLQGLTRGILTVYVVDPNNFVFRPYDGDTATFGHRPDHIGYEDLCPPPPECPTCKPTRCMSDGSGVSFVGVTGSAFANYSIAAHPKRTSKGKCRLEAVGKPVYYRYTDSFVGAWMQDSNPTNPKDTEKFWVTLTNDSFALYEFANKSAFRENVPTKIHQLQNHGFSGNSHVVYKGSFYYHANGTSQVMRYDLETGNVAAMPVPEAEFSETRLYNSRHSFFDFNVDENGIWVIYGLRKVNTTVVVKFDAATLQIEYAWNVTLEHHKVGDMFIVCGVLYAVDSLTEGETKIRFGLDLYYHQQVSDVDLTFSNPFRLNTMVGYNPRTKELISWDKGNQLAYPIKYTSSGDEDVNGPETSALLETTSPEGYAFAG